MKIVEGVFFIFLFYFLGECISYLVDGFLPGSIIGMVLLFLSLHLKIINSSKVKATAQIITGNMMIFFIPAAVGLMTNFAFLRENWIPLLVACVFSTILVLVVVAVIQEKMEGGWRK
ncbi:CidA/LrgA family protein [Massilibacteroides vaginae]|uniref:CidA/LrgA family protein n=1 Tax=Massilibacteroides vaginae TaxID=1673718 RepID=UPI000A1CD015|nr:CidA/LrgA family protein [Massilibacteroides vaginae]